MFAGLTLALLTSLFIFQTAKTQNILFHLLGNSTPTVYFALPTQNFSEMNGAWIDWPAGLLSWSKRRAISLTGPATTLSNFSVLVALDSTRLDYATTAAGGTDLRFTLDDGTALPYEIENWDSAGTSHVWVTLPTYTAYPAQTRIWMYHGNPAAANAQNASATWGTSHIGVWHLDGDAVDSSGGARNGTNTGATGATGLSGRAMAFTGTSTYIRLPDTMISDKTTATFEAWVKTSSSDAGVIGGETQPTPLHRLPMFPLFTSETTACFVLNNGTALRLPSPHRPRKTMMNGSTSFSWSNPTVNRSMSTARSFKPRPSQPARLATPPTTSDSPLPVHGPRRLEAGEASQG